MKIYHTETVEDFDALMVELEEQGCKWLSGRKPTEAKYDWFNYGKKTCVRRISSAGILTKFDFGYSKENYPSVPIIEYKAKADEKMKFTKENIEGLVNKYFDDNVGECPGNLIAEIYAMDDTPEKVVVPKFVAEWLAFKKTNKDSLHVAIDGDWQIMPKEMKDWLSIELNDEVFARAWLDGYTIEPEQLYYIPLPDLETSDGLQQVLSKRDTYFASRPNEKLKQQFTKEELKHVPVSYKPYAKPIKEEEEWFLDQ